VIDHLNDAALEAAFLDMMQPSEYATGNVERENGCANHTIPAVDETYRKLT